MRKEFGVVPSNLTAKQRGNVRAYANVSRQRGILVEQPCGVCGTMVYLEMHHFDYTRPVEVIWLCHKHHRSVHRGEIDWTTLPIHGPEYIFSKRGQRRVAPSAMERVRRMTAADREEKLAKWEQRRKFREIIDSIPERELE